MIYHIILYCIVLYYILLYYIILYYIILGGDQRAVWQRAGSSRQDLNGHRQVYSHLCLFPNVV